VPDQVSGIHVSHDPDIFIVGLGLRVDHLSPETELALRSSRRVFYVSHVPEVAQRLESWCNDVTDLAVISYREQIDRLDAYKRMAATVIDGALEAPPVALALYGHPLVLSQPSTITLRTAARIGLRTKVLPAISALDCLIADLGVDPLATGVQMHEATNLLLYRRPLLPDMATIVWQVGLLETRLHTAKRYSRPERLLRLRDHLLRFYPPTHSAFGVSSSVQESTPPEIHRFRLEQLPELSFLLHPGMTMYIPPSSARPIADQELFEKLRSASHLHEIVH
jgi:uroporphyrin-III C-methyltransferase